MQYMLENGRAEATANIPKSVVIRKQEAELLLVLLHDQCVRIGMAPPPGKSTADNVVIRVDESGKEVEVSKTNAGTEHKRQAFVHSTKFGVILLVSAITITYVTLLALPSDWSTALIRFLRRQ